MFYFNPFDISVQIDKGWRDFNADGSSTTVPDNHHSDSHSTLNEIDLTHYKSVRDQNNQLRKSLEEGSLLAYFLKI